MGNDSSPSTSTDGEWPHMHGYVWREEYLTDVTYPNLVTLTVIISLAIFPTILLNALVILAVTTRHRLQRDITAAGCLATKSWLMRVMGRTTSAEIC